MCSLQGILSLVQGPRSLLHHWHWVIIQLLRPRNPEALGLQDHPWHSVVLQQGTDGAIIGAGQHNPVSGPVGWSACRLFPVFTTRGCAPALSLLFHPLQQWARSGASSPGLKSSGSVHLHLHLQVQSCCVAQVRCRGYSPKYCSWCGTWHIYYSDFRASSSTWIRSW